MGVVLPDLRNSRTDLCYATGFYAAVSSWLGQVAEGASCEMGTRAGGVLSQLLHAPTEALAEGAASGAFPRSVVPKASIWTWGIPQNCHTVIVHVCKITHT